MSASECERGLASAQQPEAILGFSGLHSHVRLVACVGHADSTELLTSLQQGRTYWTGIAMHLHTMGPTMYSNRVLDIWQARPLLLQTGLLNVALVLL